MVRNIQKINIYYYQYIKVIFYYEIIKCTLNYIMTRILIDVYILDSGNLRRLSLANTLFGSNTFLDTLKSDNIVLDICFLYQWALSFPTP